MFSNAGLCRPPFAILGLIMFFLIKVQLFGLCEMLKHKKRGVEGCNGFLEVVLTSSTYTDDRKKKNGRF